MNSRLRSIVVLAVASLAACTTNRFVVKMTPVAGGLHRELTGWREKQEQEKWVESPLPIEVRRRLADAYRGPLPRATPPRSRFEATFPSVLPNDLGGSGWFVRLDTPIGAYFEYREHIGGSLDRDALVDLRRTCADRMTELLIAWMRKEMGTHPRFDNVKAALDTKGRRLLRDTLHLVAEDRSSLATVLGDGPVGDYLVEHDLLDPKDVVVERSADQATLPTKVLRRLVRHAFEIPDDGPSPAVVAFLDDESIEASWKAFVAESPEVAAVRTTIDAQRPRGGAWAEFDDAEILMELFLRGVVDANPYDARGRASLSLETGVAPFETDGTWRSPRVEWAKEDVPLPGQMATAHFARWSVPATAYQTERFGRVLLEGRSLANYAQWRARLAAERRQAWDASVAALRPGEDLRPAVERLQLEGPDGDERANEGRKILLYALGP